ncbi:hypothetical protein [Flavihumibacter petaseus]|uniref:CARDB domain-containing protein n=1 Tax=Flavihumibacter petaseus NBRC 106054 TaxID=1220578 RepID=A0A0E9N2N4_9BACT|nr:hypothetical protein [Flavihumibacter petaseus]GAO44267.1 hypothetical protein FPE01S_03_03050 [Flavihumibacter petaseus NBRC 106054]
MNKFLAAFCVSLALLLIGIYASAQLATLPPNIQKNISVSTIPGDIKLSPEVAERVRIKKIDLTAKDIVFSMVKCYSATNGVVKIEGVLKNTGGLAYSTAVNQQSLLLYENSGSGPRLVATKVFQNLAPGAEVRVSFTRNWNKSSPAEGEFPPVYTVVVSFDPDIYIDGNDNNDDSNAANNRLEKSGSFINKTTWTCK